MLTLGMAIRRLRRAGGLTQRQLAHELGVDPSYLSHLEADRKEPSIQLIRSLARALGVPPGLLIATLMSVDLPASEREVFGPILDKLFDIAEIRPMTKQK